MTAIKKIVAWSMSLFMAFYGFIGMTGNVSDDFTEGKYKNVILMIGDGMGFNTLNATELLRGDELENEQLYMRSMPVCTQSQTHSFLIPATDSAAGGTALATGLRVWINSVGLFPFDPFTINDLNVPINLCELAKSDGKAAGVVTTDSTSGATPASFSAHALARDMEENISADQLASGIDLIWGAESESINEENTAENGFTYVTNEDQLMALEDGSKSFAQFKFDDLKNCTNEYNTPTIEEMTEKAIDILSANEDGFFLMVEGACIDKFSHDNNFEGSTMSTVEFDKAIKAALDFAAEDGETLVVVTADHETGGITADGNGSFKYTSGDHTNVDVPVYVSAKDAGFKTGDKVKNREIPVQIARVMGYTEKEFPASK